MEIVAVAALGLLGYELKGRKTAKPKTCKTFVLYNKNVLGGMKNDWELLLKNLINPHQRCGYSDSPFARRDTFLYCRVQKWVGRG